MTATGAQAFLVIECGELAGGSGHEHPVDIMLREVFVHPARLLQRDGTRIVEEGGHGADELGMFGRHEDLPMRFGARGTWARTMPRRCHV